MSVVERKRKTRMYIVQHPTKIYVVCEALVAVLRISYPTVSFRGLVAVLLRSYPTDSLRGFASGRMAEVILLTPALW